MLAPAAYYAPFDLRALERAIDVGAQLLGHGYGVQMSFAFDVLPEELALPPLPSGRELLALLDQRRPLH